MTGSGCISPYTESLILGLTDRDVQIFREEFNQFRHKLTEKGDTVLILWKEMPLLLSKLSSTHTETDAKTCLNELEISSDGKGWILDFSTFVLLMLQRSNDIWGSEELESSCEPTEQWKHLMQTSELISTEPVDQMLSKSFKGKQPKTSESSTSGSSTSRKNRISELDQLRYSIKSWTPEKGLRRCIKYPNFQGEYGIEFPQSKTLRMKKSTRSKQRDKQGKDRSQNQQLQPMGRHRAKSVTSSLDVSFASALSSRASLTSGTESSSSMVSSSSLISSTATSPSRNKMDHPTHESYVGFSDQVSVIPQRQSSGSTVLIAEPMTMDTRDFENNQNHNNKPSDINSNSSSSNTPDSSTKKQRFTHRNSMDNAHIRGVKKTKHKKTLFQKITSVFSSLGSVSSHEGSPQHRKAESQPRKVSKKRRTEDSERGNLIEVER